MIERLFPRAASQITGNQRIIQFIHHHICKILMADAANQINHQQFFKQLHQLLSPHLSSHSNTVTNGNTMNELNWNDLELTEDCHHLIIHSLINRQLSTLDECMEWAEAYIHLFPHVHQRLITLYEPTDNQKQAIQQRFDSYRQAFLRPSTHSTKNLPSNTINDPTLVSVCSNHAVLLEEIVNKTRQIARNLSIKTFPFLSHTPLGHAMIMFAMYQNMVTELTAQSVLSSYSNDSLFPIFLYILVFAFTSDATNDVTDVNSHDSNAWSIWQSLQFVESCRCGEFISQGESGWGYTNVLSAFTFICKNACSDEADEDNEEILRQLFSTPPPLPSLPSASSTTSPPPLNQHPLLDTSNTIFSNSEQQSRLPQTPADVRPLNTILKGTQDVFAAVGGFTKNLVRNNSSLMSPNNNSSNSLKISSHRPWHEFSSARELKVGELEHLLSDYKRLLASFHSTQ